MNLPFGIAVYEHAPPTKLEPLPHVSALRTVEQSREAAVPVALVVDLAGLPMPRETRSVRRRRTTVSEDTATDVAYRVLALRRAWSRAALARYIGITVRDLHLAELGSVQPNASYVIISALNRGVPEFPDNPRSGARRRDR